MRFIRWFLVVVIASLLLVFAAVFVGQTEITTGASPSGFIALSGDAAASFTLPTDVQLVTSSRLDTYGLTRSERYQQYVGPAQVLGGQLTLYRDDSGAIVTVIGAHYSDLAPTNIPSLSKADARGVAERDVGPAEQTIVDLMIDPETGRHFIRVESRSLASRWFHWIDAASGQVINRYDALETGDGIGVKGDTKSMTGLTTLHSSGRPTLRGYWLQSSGNRQLTYDDANNGGNANIMIDSDDHWDLLGNNSPGQPAGVDAQYYANVTDDYYLSIHGRNSFDDNGAAMRSIVHVFATDYNNAFWNGSIVAYGDGDGTNFREFSGGLDVVGHEWTHAVTDFTSDLIYQNESGALNESFSDQMGNSIEFFARDPNGDGIFTDDLDPAATPDWFIGEDIYQPADDEPGFRNMADPREDNDPDHYSELENIGTNIDNGGVHSNSGVPNHAYYLLVNGGQNAGCDATGSNGHTHTADCDVTVTAIPLSAAERIFYLGFTGLNSSATFCDARFATEAVASSFDGGVHAASTTDAWLAVGLTDAACGAAPTPTDTPTPTPTATPEGPTPTPTPTATPSATPVPGDLDVAIQVSGNPQPGDRVTILVTVTDSGGPVSGAAVAVTLDTTGRDYVRNKTTNDVGVALIRIKTKSGDGFPWSITADASKNGSSGSNTIVYSP